MATSDQDARGTAYTITVDAADRVSTGISAADRAHTLRVLADPTSTPESLDPPGHILPLRADEGGVRERAGHTEAAVDLMKLAGLSPVGVIGEIVGDDGEMMRLPGLHRARRPRGPARHDDRRPHRLPAGMALRHRRAGRRRRCRRRSRVDFEVETTVPTTHGTIHDARLPRPPDRRRPRGHRRGRPRAIRSARARALRVPHRRGLRLAQVRVRPAARCRARHHPARRRHRHLPARPRGSRHRPHQQAACLPAAGGRPRHPRRQPRPRTARRRARLRRRDGHPRRPGHHRGARCSPTTPRRCASSRSAASP